MEVVVSDRGVAYAWGSVFAEEDSADASSSSSQRYSFKPTPINIAKLLASSAAAAGGSRCVDNEEEEEEEDASAGELVCAAACGARSTLLLLASGKIVQWDRAAAAASEQGEGDALVWPSPSSSPPLYLAVKQIACGATHSLLIDSTGSTYAWGATNNTHGQLGMGDFLPRSTPTAVPDLQCVRAIRVAGGERHSLCATQCGDVYAFGFNEHGQLGLGNTIGQPSPVLIVGLDSRCIVDVQCGAWHSGALAEDGALFLFGSGSFGKLGNGSEADVLLPVRENESLQDKQSRIVSFSLGATHSACVLEDGRLFVWGSEPNSNNNDDDDGGGGGGATVELFPQERKVQGGVKFASVRCSRGGGGGGALNLPTLAIARGATGNLYAWGVVGGAGEGGATLLMERLCPSSTTAAAAGVSHVYNVSSALQQARLPFPMLGKLAVKELATGKAHTVLLSNNGLVFAFGSNEEGQCGMQRASPMVPQRVRINESGGVEDVRIATIACGFNHTLLVTQRAGQMLEFGRNKFHPTLVPCEYAIAKVSTGENHSACIAREGGVLLTWGQTRMGKLGLGPLATSVVQRPTRVLFSAADLFRPVEIAHVSCGRENTLAVTAGGHLYGFGLLQGRELVEEPRALPLPSMYAAGGGCLSVSAADMHSVCVSEESGQALRISSRDNFAPISLSQRCTQAVACSEGRTLLLAEDGKVFVVERNEMTATKQLALGLGDDGMQSIVAGGGLSRDGAAYSWLRATSSLSAAAAAGTTSSAATTSPAPSSSSMPTSPSSATTLVGGGGSSATSTIQATLLSSLAPPITLDSLLAMQLKDARVQVHEFKRQYAQLPEAAKVPVGAIQLLLRDEAKHASELSDDALRDQVFQARLWDRKNLDHLRALKQRERDVLAPLEISCQFAVQHATRMVAEQDCREAVASSGGGGDGGGGHRAILRGPFASCFSASRPLLPQGEDVDNTDAVAVPPNPAAAAAARLPQHLISAIPVVEMLLGILLVNPGFMFTLFQQRLASNDVFAGLCRDLYRGSDAHSERRFCILVRQIARYELATAAAAGQVDSFDAFLRQPSTSSSSHVAVASSGGGGGGGGIYCFFFPALFDLLPVRYPELQAKIRSILRKELLVLRNAGGSKDLDAALRRLFLHVFVEQVVGDVLVANRSYGGGGGGDGGGGGGGGGDALRVFAVLHGVLMDQFGAAQAEPVALWLCRFLAQRLFLPVLFEQCVREDWAELYHAMDRILQRALRPVQVQPKRRNNFEQTLSRYHGLVRGNLPLKERIDLDQALIEATTGAKKRDFVLKFEDVASKFRLLHLSAAPQQPQQHEPSSSAIQPLTETELLFRMAGLGLVRRELLLHGVGVGGGGGGQDQAHLDEQVDVDAAASSSSPLAQELVVELMFDMVREEMRPQDSLVVYLTRRSLEYVHLVIQRAAEEDANLSSQTAERKFFLSVCRQARKELKGRWDEPALGQFDDFHGTTLRLDLSTWSLIGGGGGSSSSDATAGWTAQLVQDGATGAPIPWRFAVPPPTPHEPTLPPSPYDVDSNARSAAPVEGDVLGINRLQQVLDQAKTLLRAFRQTFMGLASSSSSSSSMGDAAEHVDFVRSSHLLVQEMEARVQLSQTTQFTQHLQEMLALEIGAAHRILDERIDQLKQFSNVLRHGDPSKRRLEELAKRKLGPEFALTDFHFVRALQLGEAVTTSTSPLPPARLFRIISGRRLGRRQASLPAMDVPDAALCKQQLSEHGLVRGASGTYTYATLHARHVVFRREEDNANSTGVFDAGSSSNWAKLCSKLRFHLFINASTARLSILLTYDAVTVLASAELDIARLVNFSRTCTLDWEPNAQFPVTFRVRALLYLVQEMVLRSFM